MKMGLHVRRLGCLRCVSRGALALGLCIVLLWCVPIHAASPAGFAQAQYVLPQRVQDEGISFAGIPIPLKRPEVGQRVVAQVNYLLMDRRAVMMEWFDRLAERGEPVQKVLADEKVPADLIYLSVLISGFTPDARTGSGGIGWWGLGAAAGKKKRSVNLWVVTNDWDDRRDPVISTRIAATILHSVLRRKPARDWLTAICSFLDGTEAIDAVLKKSAGFSYWDLVMPQYSDLIVPRLVALKIIHRHRDFYAVNVPLPKPIQYDFLDRLKLRKDLPLYVVAKWCGTSPRSIWELNPGVAPSTGTLPKPDKRMRAGFPLRVPKGMGAKVRKLLIRQGYLAK